MKTGVKIELFVSQVDVLNVLNDSDNREHRSSQWIYGYNVHNRPHVYVGT